MKRKTLRTRKQRALRRTLAALALLGLCMAVGTWAYYPTVESVVRDMEETVNCAGTRHILTLDPSETEGERVELWGNEKVLLLGAFRRSLSRGWEARGYTQLDCTLEGTILQGLKLKENGESIWYFVARVEDPRGAMLHMELGYGGDDNWVCEMTLDMSRKDWFRQGDDTYAVGRLPVDEGALEHPDRCYIRARLTDENGEPLWETGYISATYVG